MEKKETILTQRYALGKLLGHGNFAKVYYGRDIRSGQSVAIKVIDKEKVLRDGLINPINREVSVMRRLQHPNIVQLYDVIESETKTYLVMEYLGGGELFDKVARGKLEEGVARKYFQQLTCAIGYCHSRGVYHRDIKPENLLLDESGNLKIADFGLSALFETRGQDGLLHTTCGTPSYMSPEVINRKGYDGAKADIWSCGVVLFILLAGYHPFQHPSNIEQQRKITRGDFRFPTWFNAQVRKLLVSILVPDPDRRVSLDTIMEHSWFKKGYKPRFRGFNLSEKKQGHEADPKFTTTKTLAGIISKLEEAIKWKKKDSYVKLQCYKGAKPVLTY